MHTLGFKAADGDATDLHVAAQRGDVESVRRLATAATVNVRCGAAQRTPLHLAAAAGRRAAVAALLMCEDVDVEARDATGDTPLLVAVQAGFAVVVHQLVLAGASAATASTPGGHTPVMWAVYRGASNPGAFKLLSYLLGHAGAPANARDAKGATALHWCAMKRGHKMVPLLVRHGCDPAALGPDNKTALDVALDNGDSLTASALVDAARGQPRALPFAAWVAVLPALFALLHVHWAAFAVVALLGVWRLFMTRAMMWHVVGVQGFRSAVPFAFMCGTGVLLYVFNALFFLAAFPVSSAVFHMAMVGMFVGLYRVKTQGPGVAAPPPVGDWAAVEESRFCPLCVIHTPIRSHHCARCGVCVARFDHHCELQGLGWGGVGGKACSSHGRAGPWIDECVGQWNNWEFLYMVLFAGVAHVAFLWQAWAYVDAQLRDPAGLPFTELVATHQALALFCVLSALQLAGEGALVTDAQAVHELAHRLLAQVYVQFGGAVNDRTQSEMSHPGPNPYDR